MKKNNVKENQVYKYGSPPLIRRVITIHKGYVCYTKGGKHSRVIKLESFKNWIKRQKAELIYEQQSEK